MSTEREPDVILETASLKQMRDQLEEHLVGLIGRASGQELDAARNSWSKALGEGPAPEKDHARVFMSSSARFLGFNVALSLLDEAEKLTNEAISGMSPDLADPANGYETATLAKNIDKRLLLTPLAMDLANASPAAGELLLDQLDGAFLMVLGLLRRSIRRRDPDSYNHDGEGQILFVHNVRLMGNNDQGALLYTRVQMLEQTGLSPRSPVAGTA